MTELFSYETEQIVLGNAIKSPKLILSIAKTLSEASFYYDKHKIIWRAILKTFETEESVDLLMITDKIESEAR